MDNTFDQPSQPSMPQIDQQPMSHQVPPPYNPPVVPSYDDEPRSTNRVLTIILGIIVLVGIAGVSYYLGTKNSGGGLIMSSKPTITTAPTITPTPTPDITATWPVFTSAKYLYSVKYPENLTVNEQNQYYYYVEFDGAKGTLPPFVISVIPDTFTVTNIAAYNLMSSDYINELYALKIGESKTTSTGTTLTKVADTTVDGQPAVVIGVVATGFKQHRVYVKKNGKIYMISDYYQGPEDLKYFQSFLSTFKFAK